MPSQKPKRRCDQLKTNKKRNGDLLFRFFVFGFNKDPTPFFQGGLSEVAKATIFSKRYLPKRHQPFFALAANSFRNCSFSC